MTRATLLWALVALGSVGAAIAMRPIDRPPPNFQDTNEPLFASFNDPTQAASLEVRTWNTQAAQLSAFKVEIQDGRWVIPSHHNYPADGVERMGRAAASFIGVRKDVVRSDDPKDHAALGLADPESPDAKDDEKGQRVLIKDASGTVLVDVIVGKAVPERNGYRYVRYAGNNRSYAAKLQVDVSTAFADWIEKDLLKLDDAKVVAIESNSYRVDEASGRVLDAQPLLFLREAVGSEKWTLAANTFAPSGQVVKEASVRALLGAADRLKIVGIRPQPQRLDAMSLLNKGFFYSPENKQLYGNEGQVRLICEDGVTYTLFFGEVTSLSGTELTAGAAQEEAAKEVDKKDKGQGKEADKEAGKETGDNRFMFVVVGYQAELDKTKSMPAANGDPSGTGTSSGSSADGTGSADASGSGSEATPALSGEARARVLGERFNKWFYVIPNSSFTQLHKAPSEFFEAPKPAPKAEADGD